MFRAKEEMQNIYGGRSPTQLNSLSSMHTFVWRELNCIRQRRSWSKKFNASKEMMKMEVDRIGALVQLSQRATEFRNISYN